MMDGESGKFCVNCAHYISGKTSREATCGLSGAKCSRARLNASQHDCGRDAQYYTPKEGGQ